MSRSGTNSIIILAFRLLPQVKFSKVNFFIPYLVASLFAYQFYPSSADSKAVLLNAMSNLMAFNGTVLGLILGVFGIYGAVESNQRTLFAVTNSPDGSKFSFYKHKLVTIFKMCFWVFLCSLFLLLLFIFLSISERMVWLSSIFRPDLKIPIYVFSVAWLQTKILVELKIYIFSMYQRSINEARALAIENKMTPFDKGID